ncbi:MAG: gliding motility-associated C-terminal domain-containing protein, partial [Chitinophagales bacterium]
SGNATITAADVDNGSADACGGAVSLSIDVSTFTCADIGANTVVLTATDVNGNSSSCNATVTVQDNIAPVAICQNITVQLDAAGNANILPTDIDNGSFDNCGTMTLSLNDSSFTCSDVGNNTVTLTADDGNGNTSTCTAIVTVEDTTAPVVNCQAITIALDINGNASILVSDVHLGSSDICGIQSTVISKNSFDCSNIGVNNVIVTSTDNNGNVSSCTAIVTVEDNFAPTLIIPDTVCLNSNGTVEVTPSRPGSEIKWFSDALGNNNIYVGNPFTTPVLTATATSFWFREVFANGCMSPVAEVIVYTNLGIAPTVSSNSPVCVGEELIINGQAGFVSYTWVGPNGFSSNDEDVIIDEASLLNDGIYTLEATSVNGCVSNTASITIVINTLPTISTPLQTVYSYCEESDIAIDIVLDVDQSGTWTGPNGFSSNTEDINIANCNENLHEGVYTLELTNTVTGCKSDPNYSTNISIDQRPEIVSITGGNIDICPGESFTLEASYQANVTYNWEGPDNYTSTANPIIITNASPQNTGLYFVYSTQGSCTSDTVSTELGIYPDVPIAITSDSLVYVESDIITLTASGGIAYQWVPTAYLDDPSNAVVNIVDAPFGPYTFEVYGIDLNTCLDSATIDLVIKPRTILEVNDVISPNGDGMNDSWNLGFVKNAKDLQIKVFDRGGMQVFDAVGTYNNNWKGTLNGVDLPAGAYFYYIKANGKEYKGGLTIIR